MSDDLLVECPIHLDAVSSKDILMLRCGHGFCEPCLEEHTRRSSHHLCPTCRNPFRRREAFHIFLTPAYSMTQNRSTDSETQHTRLVRELRELKAEHAHCPERVVELQHEMGTLQRDISHRDQTIHHLRGRCDSQEERLAKEADKSARVKEENGRLKEEMTKLQVETHKTSLALEQAIKERQVEHERAKMFQGYMEQHKRKYNLERKKRKAIENAGSNHYPQFKKEEESLMVVDANAPDVLCQNGPDFGWLDEACKVKGDQLAVSDGEEMELEEGGELDEAGVQFEDRNHSENQGELHQFRSDWNLGLGESSHGTTRKRGHESRPAGATKIIRMKVQRRPEGSPLAIDRNGRVKGTVALGSRQKFNSKN